MDTLAPFIIYAQWITLYSTQAYSTVCTIEGVNVLSALCNVAYPHHLITTALYIKHNLMYSDVLKSTETGGDIPSLDWLAYTLLSCTS